MMVLDVIAVALMILCVSVFGLVLSLIVAGVDRKIVARLQHRIGPVWYQPFLDIWKLLYKQNTIPAEAVRAVYNAAPIAALATALLALFYLPLGDMPPLMSQHGDAILVLYVLLLPSLAMVVGGFSSASPYAVIGAQREMITMVAYELPLAAVIITWAWKLSSLGIANPFSLEVMAANPIWHNVGPLGFIGVVLMGGIMLLVLPAEVGRIPFDSPEAETELAGGVLVEYSGRNLALFQLSLHVKTIAMAALIVTLFIPWSFSSVAFLPLSAGMTILTGFLFFLLKISVVIFLGMTVLRAACARLRITQIVKVYWHILGSAALFALFLIVLDAKL